MSTTMTLLERKAADLLRAAVPLYEEDPKGGISEIALIFLHKEGEIQAVPVQVQVDLPTLDVARGAPFGGRMIEHLVLQGLKSRAAMISPDVLLGVGYLFPATGDFPETDHDLAIVGLLRAKGATVTPWTREGVVLLIDTAEGRLSWASLRDQGEVADPLSEPSRKRVEAGHIQRLYPHTQPAIRWD
jgi:hypothetical protein